jgi:hypothetical protein
MDSHVPHNIDHYQEYQLKHHQFGQLPSKNQKQQLQNYFIRHIQREYLTAISGSLIL